MRPDKCKNGHPNVEANRASNGRCKVCKNLYAQRLYAKQKEIYESQRLPRTREQEIEDLIKQQKSDDSRYLITEKHTVHPDGWRGRYEHDWDPWDYVVEEGQGYYD